MATLSNMSEEFLPLVSTIRFSVGMSFGMHSLGALSRLVCRPMSPAAIKMLLASDSAAE